MPCSRPRRSRARRVVALASPNDPTGELLATAALERLLDGLPDGVAVLLDESLVEFADAQPTDCLAHAARGAIPACSCSAASPRRGGWPGCASATRSAGPARRICWPNSSPISASRRSPRPAPWRRFAAARSCSPSTSREICRGARARDRGAARARASRSPTARPTSCGPRTRLLEGDELAARLARAGVLVAGGAALGEPRHVRIGLRNAAASDRLLGAIDKALAAPSRASLSRPTRPGAAARPSSPRGSCARR